MATVKSVVDELRAKGKEKTRAIYLRHGMPADERTLGVSTADMKLVTKKRGYIRKPFTAELSG